MIAEESEDTTTPEITTMVYIANETHTNLEGEQQNNHFIQESTDGNSVEVTRTDEQDR